MKMRSTITEEQAEWSDNSEEEKVVTLRSQSNVLLPLGPIILEEDSKVPSDAVIANKVKSFK